MRFFFPGAQVPVYTWIMGKRGKKPAEDRAGIRSVCIRFMATPAEAEAVKRAATAGGYNVSEYIRFVALAGR